MSSMAGAEGALTPMKYQFFVPGKPQTAGSKRAPIAGVVIDDNPRSHGWKKTVGAYCLRDCGRPMLTGAVAMQLRFVRLRPLTHFVGRKRDRPVRKDAPEWPTGVPDTLKLARAVEDGLTGVMYVDDAQIVVQTHMKVYGEREGVHVHVQEM